MSTRTEACAGRAAASEATVRTAISSIAFQARVFMITNLRSRQVQAACRGAGVIRDLRGWIGKRAIGQSTYGTLVLAVLELVGGGAVDAHDPDVDRLDRAVSV